MIDERTIELIHAGIDGELGEADQAELGERLERSDDARRYQERMRELSAFLDRVPEQEMPDRLHGRILEQISLPSAKTRGLRFTLGELPGFVRYGFAVAAGLLLAVGIYESQPLSESQQDFSSMVGTIMPGGDASVEAVLDSFSFEMEQLSSTVSLERRDGALVLDVRLVSKAPVEIGVDFTSDGLQFDAIAQIHSDLDSINVADRSIRVRARGRQHFAVLLHRGPDQAVGGESSIRLEYSSDGKLLNSGTLVTK